MEIDLGSMTGDMPGGDMLGGSQSEGGEKKEKDMDQVAVEKGADLALQSQGIPPPLSTMIGEEVGEKYTEVKEKLDPSKYVEKGAEVVTNALDAVGDGPQGSESASQEGFGGADPAGVAEALLGAVKQTKENVSNFLQEFKGGGEMLDNANKKEAAPEGPSQDADLGASASKGMSLGM